MAIATQALLRDAMRRLNMTRDAFAERIGCRRRTLDSWLLPDESSEYRAMPEVARRYVTEILANLPDSPQDGSGSGLSANHLLSVDQLSRESVEELFWLADVMQPIARRQKVTRVLEGAVLANLFFEASTSTRISFVAAFCRLGGSVCDSTGFTCSSMAKG
jgi:aspartate carbamoyltransferase catalytic subunit